MKVNWQKLTTLISCLYGDVHMSEHSINPEGKKSEGKNKLDELRREAMAGEEDYARGQTTLIENDDALDRFFTEIAVEADKR